jgi:hypothetical protein
VKSVSWPTPLTTGSSEAKIARATTSSLNAQRSSRLPAAPPDDQHVAFGARVGELDRAHELRRRALALHPRRIENHRGHRSAPRERGQHVAQARGLGRGDDADGARERGQGAFARRLEEPSAGKLRLQFLERLVERAQARLADLLTTSW